jgi:hypothetical protein
MIRAIAATVVALLVVAPAVVVAQTGSHTATSGVTYETNSGVEVSLTDQRQVTATPFPSSDTFSDQNVTISGSNAAVGVDGATYTGSSLTVTDMDVKTVGSLTVNRTDLNRQATFKSGSAAYVTLNQLNTTDNNADFAYRSVSGLTVEFSGLSGDRVTAVDTSTGQAIETVQTTSGGTATFTLPADDTTVRLDADAGGGGVLLAHYVAITAGAVVLTGAWLFKPEDRTAITTLGAFLAWGLTALLGGSVTTYADQGAVLRTPTNDTALAVAQGDALVGAAVPDGVRLFAALWAVLSALALVLYVQGVYPPTEDFENDRKQTETS